MTDPVRPVAPREPQYDTDDATWLEELADSLMRPGVKFYGWTPMRLRAVAAKLRLAAAPVPCAASPADRHPEFPQFAACVHCGWISAKELCPQCDRERDSGIKPLRATGEGARDAVPGLPAVPVPPIAPVEELAAVAPPLQGSWAADDWRRAFVEGAQWWEWTKEGATMWPSDRNTAEGVAEERFARLRGEATVRVHRCKECRGEVYAVKTASGLMFRCDPCHTDWFPATVRVEE